MPIRRAGEIRWQARPAGQDVVARPAVYQVLSGTAVEEGVVAAVAVDDVLAGLALDDIAAFAAPDGVVAPLGIDLVVAVATVDRVVALAGGDLVIPVATPDGGVELERDLIAVFVAARQQLDHVIVLFWIGDGVAGVSRDRVAMGHEPLLVDSLEIYGNPGAGYDVGRPREKCGRIAVCSRPYRRRTPAGVSGIAAARRNLFARGPFDKRCQLANDELFLRLVRKDIPFRGVGTHVESEDFF